MSLFGGGGTVWAALLGALVIGSIANGMDLRGRESDVKFLITGGALLGPSRSTRSPPAVPAGSRRFLRTTTSGLLRVDRAAVAAEAKLDGKFLLRTSDPTMSAEDVAFGKSSCWTSSAAGGT